MIYPVDITVTGLEGTSSDGTEEFLNTVLVLLFLLVFLMLVCCSEYINSSELPTQAPVEMEYD